MIRAILTDIEGTTSSIAFVTDTLFPYARAHLREWVGGHAAAAAPLLAEVQAQEHGDPIETLLRWMDEDRKVTPLKTLQGLIWAEGYADGTLHGHIYPDAAEALRAWHVRGLGLYVYSSGSIAAQKLIFGHSLAGDLTPLFTDYFDTTSGPKQEADSYARIAASIGLPPEEILFLSDHPGEIAAANAAGLATTLIDRDRETPGAARSFAEIAP